jgi:hypothetical protein
LPLDGNAAKMRVEVLAMKVAYAVPAVLLGLACDSSRNNPPIDTSIPTFSEDADTSGATPEAVAEASADAGVVADAGGNADAAADVGASPDAAAAADGGSIETAPITYRFPAEVLVKGCAKALACSTTGQIVNEGITHCAEVVNWMGSTDWGRNTFMLALYDDSDWLLFAGLTQNMDCVQAAVGCQAILACVNQGQVNPTCSPPSNYSLGRYCSDATHVRACSLGIEASMDCGKLGLACIEVSASNGSKTMATCALPAAPPGPLDSFEVTCQGNMAQFSFGAARYGFDCSFIGSTCVPGSYPLSASSVPYCVGAKGASCEKSGSNRCEGDDAVLCFNGREGGMACADIGATCNTVGPNPNPHCGFACASISDTCTDGVISYCGPAGQGTLDCRSLGFSGCGLALPSSSTPEKSARAYCVP